MASAARFDMVADQKTGSIDGGRVTQGNGSIERMNWVPESEQARGFTVNFPVTHLGWRALAVGFKPAHSGTVTLTLMGPFEEVSKGVVYRQELLWDDVEVEGALLVGGGFEVADRTGLRLAKRRRVLGRAVPDVRAVEGTHYARTWHNQTLFTTFNVVGGQPVTDPPACPGVRVGGMREMKRIAGGATPAHLAARRFLRGANLGNGLEAPPGQDWGVHYTPDDLRIIRAEGFDHVRIPVGWHHYTGPGPEFRIRPEIFARADELVNAGLREGLGVMINIHHFDDFTSDPKGQTPGSWRSGTSSPPTTHKAPEGLAFELLNEPKDAATTEVINPIFAEAIRQIRKIDPKPHDLRRAGRVEQHRRAAQARLPDDDQNLIVTVHNYEPFYFTHQGADWAGPDTKVTGILFPGPPPRPLVPDPKLKVNSWVLDWIKAYNTEPAATNPSGPHGLSRVDRPGQGMVRILRPADPCRRVRLLHEGRPRLARQLLPLVPRGGRKSRYRLGHLGLESRIPLLERARPASPSRACMRRCSGRRHLVQ